MQTDLYKLGREVKGGSAVFEGLYWTRRVAKADRSFGTGQCAGSLRLRDGENWGMVKGS